LSANQLSAGSCMMVNLIRAMVSVCVLCLAATTTKADQQQKVDTAPPQPATNVSGCAPCFSRPNVAFLYDHNTYDLQSGCFYRLLFDTPKAVLFRHCCCYLSEDRYYFYYRDSKFEYDLAFGKDPKSNFAGHAIWIRRFDSREWQLQTAEAVMASPR
jgi:hypothetical protein